MITQNTEKLLLIAVVSLICFSSISSSGVATPYWDENPLMLSPGESRIVTLMLQNMVGENDLTLTANLTNSEGVAALTDESLNYEVPFGRDDVPINIKIDIPSNATIGDTYEVVVSFTEISAGEGGMVGVSAGFTTKIPVKVVGQGESTAPQNIETEKESSKLVIWLVVAIILVILIILLFLAIKNNKKDKAPKKTQ